MNKYIDSEIILQRKVGPLIYVYIMIIIVIMLSLIIVFIILHYKTYYNVKGIVTSDENHYYIKIPKKDDKGKDCIIITNFIEAYLQMQLTPKFEGFRPNQKVKE